MGQAEERSVYVERPPDQSLASESPTAPNAISVARAEGSPEARSMRETAAPSELSRTGPVPVRVCSTIVIAFSRGSDVET